MNKIKSYLLVAILLFSCESQDELTRVHIDTYTKLFSITKDNVITIVQDSEFENLKSYLDYGISSVSYTHLTLPTKA